MRHWFVKNVIDLLPQVATAGVVSDWKVVGDSAGSRSVQITFKGKDGSVYEIQASRGEPRRGAVLGILAFDGGKRTYPDGQFECYSSLGRLLDAAGVSSFEPEMAERGA